LTFGQADVSTDHLVPFPPLDYDTLNSKRMLGGKQLVSSGEVRSKTTCFSILIRAQWRKKLHLETNLAGAKPETAVPGHHIIEKAAEDEKASLSSFDVHIGKMPEPATVILPSAHKTAWKWIGSIVIPFVAVLLHVVNLVYLLVRAYYIVMAQKGTRQTFTGAWLFWDVEVLYALKLGTSDAFV
jgi:hypothetical protein